MGNIHAVIADDEKLSGENLSNLIKINCPEVEIVGIAESILKAKELITDHEPDILFYDIKKTNEDKINFLNSIPDYLNVVIFSGNIKDEQHSLKTNTLSYLQKPIETSKLQKTVSEITNKYLRKNNNKPQRLNGNEQHQKIIINHSQGFSVLKIEDVIHLEASNNYTKIFLLNHPPIISSKSLKEFEAILDKDSFFRTHKSHIINIRYVREYLNSEGGYIIMSDNSKILISRRKHQEFLELMHQFTKFI